MTAEAADPRRKSRSPSRSPSATRWSPAASTASNATAPGGSWSSTSRPARASRATPNCLSTRSWAPTSSRSRRARSATRAGGPGRRAAGPARRQWAHRRAVAAAAGRGRRPRVGPPGRRSRRRPAARSQLRPRSRTRAARSVTCAPAARCRCRAGRCRHERRCVVTSTLGRLIFATELAGLLGLPEPHRRAGRGHRVRPQAGRRRRRRRLGHPPQFGQTFFSMLSAQSEQNVHSKEQMRAKLDSGGRSRSQSRSSVAIPKP